MIRGFLGGVLIGGAFSVVLVGVVSFFVPISTAPEITDAGPLEIDAADPAGVVAVLPEMDDPQPVAEPVVAMAPPEADGLDDVASEMATAPLTPPEMVQAVEAPAPAAESTVPEISSDDPVLPNPMALAPMEPQAPDAVDVETQTADPIAVVPTEVETVEVEAADVEAEVATIEEPATEEAEIEETVAGTPVMPDAPVAAEVTPETEPTIAPIPLPEIKTIVVEAEDAPVADPETRPAYSALPTVPPITGTPITGTPDAGMPETGADVTVNRLPTANSGDQPQADAGPQPTVRPVEMYAQAFVNEDQKPLMSILLIDQGSDLEGGEVGIAALRSFPYPISFAVDVSLPDAAERMEIYRAEGFEVLAMVDLPEGAEPSDAETTLAVAFQRMPQVVGVLEGVGAGLQPNRDVADQVTEILAQGGYGLVSQDKGLNTMPKLAVKEGVPASPIFRDFDSKDQTPTVIRRFLDQAAFKAGIEGSVIMLGRMRPETISALLVWGLQDRASQVALAPISAVLLAASGE
ncbi:divergent polysaccharide deacetylase family protein [Sulfitobacter sp. CW3]|uniref:divergent polysaccharide deacetylase family protein n=1 Tax=Sulfitobacter sp. CW3 TaxID=2861965 RepID=UPI00215135F9|nr:polysaccharide deacteylase family 2 protein [Sulfitobacter sp. CW3]